MVEVETNPKHPCHQDWEIVFMLHFLVNRYPPCSTVVSNQKVVCK